MDGLSQITCARCVKRGRRSIRRSPFGASRECRLEPSYLSKIERGWRLRRERRKSSVSPLRSAKILMWCFALAGKVSSELQAIICQRPALFAELLRTFRNLPNHAVARVVREVRDGDW